MRVPVAHVLASICCCQWFCCCCSVTKSHPTLRDPQELWHTRLPCPLIYPWVCSNSCPLSQWCHPAISFPVTHSSCPQSFPASRSFPKNGSSYQVANGQSIGASASASVLPICSGLISFRINWFDLLAVQGTLRSLLQHHSSKASIFQLSAFFTAQLSHPYIARKSQSFDHTDFDYPDFGHSNMYVVLFYFNLWFSNNIFCTLYQLGLGLIEVPFLSWASCTCLSAVLLNGCSCLILCSQLRHLIPVSSFMLNAWILHITT